ncbi:MAG TPA: ABC transporter permease [Phycisphaerae bacterium]|nr:ABC transporter permease [Phycisphaerae bacterium]
MNENYSFSLVMIAFACVMTLVTLVYVIHCAFSRQAGEICGWEWRGAARRIAAVARTTMAEGVRAKIASGFALMILIAVPVFWLTAEGDGTIKGRVQMFITYSLGFAGFVLSLLAIFFSCRSLSAEIASRQIYAIASKPIPRWQLLAGKWVGIMVFNFSLMLIVAAATYAGTRGIIARFKTHLAHELVTYGGITADQAEATVAALDRVKGVGKTGAESPIIGVFAETLGWPDQQIQDMLIKLPEATRVDLRRFDEMRRQVLVARASVSPELPDLSKVVEEAYQKLKNEQGLPEGWSDSRIRDEIRNAMMGPLLTVPPGMVREWRLKGPQPEKKSDFIMSVRFKIQAFADLSAATINGETLEKDTLLCGWGVGDPSKPTSFEQEAFYPVRTWAEFEIPVNCVEPDGTIRLFFANLDPRRVDATFDLPNGIQVLYRTGSFEKNIFQTALAIMIPVICLTSFGVCASTFLSLPVGSLIIITLFVLSISMGFVAESFAATPEYVPPKPPLDYQIRKAAVDAVGWILYIGDVDPVRKLIEGRAVGWPVLWENCWKQVLIKSLAVMAIGVLILRRRELAAVIV